MAVNYENGVYTAQMSPDDMWRQAQAEYEARTAAPRNDVFGRTLQADTPDALKEELFAPLQAYSQLLIDKQAASRPFQFHQSPFGEINLFDPNSGSVKNLRAGRPQIPKLDELTKSTQGGLEDRIKHLNGELAKAQAAGDDVAYSDISRSIQNYQSQLEKLLSPSRTQPEPFSQPFQPVTSRIETPSAVIGGAGQPNRMDWGAAPGTAFAGSPGGENMFQPSARPVSKVEIANRIASQHPEWTKAQVIAEVKRQSQ